MWGKCFFNKAERSPAFLGFFCLFRSLALTDFLLGRAHRVTSHTVTYSLSLSLYVCVCMCVHSLQYDSIINSSKAQQPGTIVYRHTSLIGDYPAQYDAYLCGSKATCLRLLATLYMDFRNKKSSYVFGFFLVRLGGEEKVER